MSSFVNHLMNRTANIQKAKHFRFLRSVFWLGFTAFGGPQMHLPYFQKRLVNKKKFLSQEELVEINAFCSILPGPSTTQTITAIGLKIGGPILAFLTLIAWALPGAAIVTIFALTPNFLDATQLQNIEACVAGFLIYAVISMFKWMQPTKLNISIFILGGLGGFIFRNPWVFPLGVILSAAISAWIVKNEHPPKTTNTAPIKWRNLTLFITIFAVVGLTGLFLTKYKTESRILKPIILFENTYRMGALSFGGGNVLAAMTVEQYVHHKKRMTLDELNTGIGLVQATPGPNFNLAVYTNTIAMKNSGAGIGGQLLGSLIGLIAVFMPGTLLVLFAFPIWERLKNSQYLRRAINGIFAMSVGFILTAALIINQNFILHLSQTSINHQFFIQIFICIGTVAILMSQKIPTPFIVLFAIILGWLIP